MSILRRIFLSGPPPTTLELNLVEAGDRFYQIGMGQSAWTVERLCLSATCDIPHAVISKEGNFPQTKILSVMALLDASVFRRDQREPGAGNATGHQRRRTDYLRKN